MRQWMHSIISFSMSTVLTYNGYDLQSDGHSYQSIINGKVRKFDTAAMFVQYINYIQER